MRPVWRVLCLGGEHEVFVTSEEIELETVKVPCDWQVTVLPPAGMCLRLMSFENHVFSAENQTPGTYISVRFNSWSQLLLCMCALRKAVSSRANTFYLRGVVVYGCGPTPTTDLITVTCPLPLIGEIQQSFSLRWPLYHTSSDKLNLPVIISFLWVPWSGRSDFVGPTSCLLLLGFLCVQLSWMILQ